MEAILDFTEFSRIYAVVMDIFDEVEQDIIQHAMVTDDTEMIEHTLYQHYIDHPGHHHTVELLKENIPEASLVYISAYDINYKPNWN